ncbi:MAG: hypothetical protein AB1515_10655 [Nitrospirota bacterium]
MKTEYLTLIMLIPFLGGCGSGGGGDGSGGGGGGNPIVCTTYTINFDTDPQGNALVNQQTLSNEYAAWDVTFSLPSASPLIIDQATDPGDAVPVSSPFLLGGNANTGLSMTEPLTIQYLNAATDIQFYIVDSESVGGSATFYDALNNVLDVVAFQVLGSGVAQLISTPATDVDRIVLTNNSASDGFFIDNLRYAICL